MYISIILPNYNHAKYLKQRIESILSQTYTEWELILLDDSSTDDSVSILKEYENNEKVSHLIVNNKNSNSPFSQWKKGIDLAEGDWIWIAESDDYSSVDFLQTLISKIEKESVLIYCESAIVDENNIRFDSHLSWKKGVGKNKWQNDYSEDGQIEFQNSMRYRCLTGNVSSCLIKKDALKINGKVLQMKYTGDWYLLGQLMQKGTVYFVAKELNFWRQHSQTTRYQSTLDKEYIRLKETMYVVSQFTLNDKDVIWNNYQWIIDWWLRRFTYRNLFRIKYVLPPFNRKLLIEFYRRLLKKVLNSLFISIKRSLLNL